MTTGREATDDHRGEGLQITTGRVAKDDQELTTPEMS